MTEIAQHPSPAPAVRPDTAEAPAATRAGQPGVRPKLDWSRVAPPKNLESARVEELSIDGICGVY